MISWLSNKIDYKKESASPPPQELWKFIVWSCGGTWKFIFLGAAASTLAGSFEMITTIALGWVVDAAQVADDRCNGGKSKGDSPNQQQNKPPNANS